ncbi:MAG: hypothetical protein AAB354_10765 [candidate division KSB1 bacterium]
MARSLLNTFASLDSGTKHSLADLDSPRLLAFSALEIAETRAGINQLSAEHIVACLEAAGVAIKRLSVIRALSAASGYVSFRKDFNDEIFYRLMTKGKREIEHVFGGKKLSVVRIEKDQPRTARQGLGEVIKGLTGTVRVCDPYYGVRTLDLLDNFPKITNVRFLTSKTNEPARQLSGALNDFKKEKPNVEFRLVDKSAGLHDRFIVSSDLILILGHGLKDIGTKESFVIRLDKELVPDLIRETIAAFDIKWNAGTAL